MTTFRKINEKILSLLHQKRKAFKVNSTIASSRHPLFSFTHRAVDPEFRDLNSFFIIQLMGAA